MAPGFVRVSVKGQQCQRFVNLCRGREMDLKRIIRTGETELQLTMKVADFLQISPLRRKTVVQIHILKKRGPLFFLLFCKRRKMIPAGFLAVFCLLFFLSGRVWNVEIRGNILNPTTQLMGFLKEQGIGEIQLVVESSIGADLAMTFLTDGGIPVHHVFFDGGQFAQIGKTTRRIMVPFLYLAIKNLYWSKGKILKKIMWCDDEAIKPYFMAAGEQLTYGNLRRQMMDSLEDRPFPALPEDLQKHTFWEFGSIEDHFKYRDAVMRAYPQGNFPVFKDFNHMQYQIREPEKFAGMLETIVETDKVPELPFVI